jgi:hypothetical protein
VGASWLVRTATMTLPSYTCPHCGAFDSTNCAKLVPVDVKPYSRQDFDGARRVGCRVAFFVDLAVKEGRRRAR